MLPSELLELLLSHMVEKWDAVVPAHNKHKEPLCAIYSKSCLPFFKSRLTKQEYKMKEALQELNVRYINVDPFPESEQAFANINTPYDLQTKIDA